MPISRQKKEKFLEKTHELLKEYSKVLVVDVTNVGARQMQQARILLRGTGRVLMGKNSLIRKAIEESAEQSPEWKSLLPKVVGNIGLVFTNGDLPKTAESLLSLRVAAPAKPGSISPAQVIIPKGNTGLEPTKTSFLQALNIPSKINKGQIELTNDVVLLRVGAKVGPSEASLLSLLGIKPFSYGLSISSVYDNGQVYDSRVLNIKDEDIIGAFVSSVQRLTSVSLAIDYPTISSFPHFFINAYKKLLAVSIASDYTYKQSETIKNIISDPAALAAIQTSISQDVKTQETPETEKEAPAAPPPEEEDDDYEGGINLFGDDE